MNTKRCHRIKVNASIFGFDPGMLMATGITFAVGCELFTNPFFSIILAGLVGACMQLLRRQRMPGLAMALCSHLLLPVRFIIHGRDRVPHLPDVSSTKGKRHVA